MPESDEALLAWRREKDAAFAVVGQSPFEPEAVATFEGLSYFEPNSALRFELELEPFEAIEIVEMETSQGEPASFERFGRLRFEVDGEPCQLTVFRDAAQGHFFLPFRDATSAAETYGAGRYVDLTPVGEKLVLDFNYAYHPFCAYSPQWLCPVPPIENTLTVPIRAGERL